MKLDRSLVRRSVELTVGRAIPANDGERRYARIARAAVAALGVRAISILVGLVSLPLTLGYLGPERYGAWVTIAAVLGWLQIADLGIANGLTNAVSEAFGRDERTAAQAHVSTAFWSIVLGAGALAATFGISWSLVDWAALLNVQTPLARAEIGDAVALAGVLFLAGLPFTTLDRIYAAHQEGLTANVWSAASNVTSLGAIFAVTHTRGGLVALVAATLGTQLSFNIANAAWLFGRHRPYLRPALGHFSRASAARLTSDGWRFLAIQIIGILLFSIDNVVITRVLGPSSVTPYAVTWRLFSIVNMVVAIYTPYLWPAYAEARAKADVDWIARTLYRSVFGSFAVALVTVVPMVMFGRWLIEAWAGAAAVPPQSLVLWMAAWTLLYAPASALSCMLNGVGHLTGQMVYGGVAAAANVVLSVLLSRVYGVSGVTAATAVSYAIFAAAPAAAEAAWVLRGIRRRAAGELA